MKTIAPAANTRFDVMAQNRWAKLAAVLTVCALSSMAPQLAQQFQPRTVRPLAIGAASLADPSALRLPVSLPNGTDIAPPLGTGYSQLTINNGNPVDAVAKLVDHRSGETVRFVYVQARQKVTLDGLDLGLYDLRFAQGTDWDEQQQRFRLNQTLTAFVEPLEFDQTVEGDQIFWRTYEVTLHPVANGTARTEPIAESEF